MAIAPDANLGQTTSAGGVNTLTLTTTGAAVANARVVVLLSVFVSTATVSSVTVGGTACVADKQVTNGGDLFQVWSCHRTATTPVGTAVVVNFSTTGTGGILIGALSLTGVPQTGYLVTTSQATGTGASWSAGTATNTGASDAAFIGGAGNEDITNPTTSVAVSGTEVHDAYNVTAQQGFATGQKVVSVVASDTISGTFSNANSTSNTGALVIYRGIVVPDASSLDPQIQWTDDFGPGEDFGPNPFLDDSAFSTNTPVAAGGTPVTFVMDAIASAVAAGIVPTVRARTTPPLAAAVASAANPTLRAIVKPVIAAATAAGLVPTARTRTAPPVAAATAAGLVPAKLTALVTAAGSAATAAGLIPRPQARSAPPVGSATAAGQVPNSRLVVHAVTATALAAAGAPIEPGGGGTGAAPQWIGLKGMDEQTAAVYAHGRRRRI